MRRTRRLADSYYRIIRAKGYSDELNVSEDELRRMLGVTNLRYDNSGYAELNFSTEKNSQAQQLFFWGDFITDVPIVYKDGRKFEKWRKALGDGTYGDPHIPYTKLDGTLETDIAAIKDSVDEPIDMVTGQLVMTG